MYAKRSVVSCICVVLLCNFIPMSVSADSLLLRLEIAADDGTEIQASAPLCLLEMLKASIPGPLSLEKSDISPLVDALMGDLSSMKGQSLVEVTDKENEIRVWIDEVNGNQVEEANFVKVDIIPGDQESEVHVRIPKGLFFLISHVGNKILETHGKEFFKQMNQMHHPHQPPVLKEIQQAEANAQRQQLQEEKKQKEVLENALKVEREVQKAAESIQKEVLENIIKELLKNLDINL